MNEDKIIEYAGVDISNGANLVLSEVNFSVEKGEFVYIIGKVGSGKTSIIKTLIGETKIKKGSASCVGYDLVHLKSKNIPYLRRKIGVVFQDFQLLMDRSVKDNLLFVLRATGWKDRKSIDSRIEKVLNAVGMNLKAHKMPHQLSGGEQQRIAIARALLNTPELILADEPTGNLDPDTTSEIMDLLMSLHRANKVAIVMITHNTEIFTKYPARTLICENSTCHELDRKPTEINLDLLGF